LRSPANISITMRVFLLLAALVAAAAANHGGFHGKVIPDLFEEGKEYDFTYRSLVATGLPRQTKQVAGLEKNAVLTVQVQKKDNLRLFGLFLRHVNTGSFDKQVEDFTRPVNTVHTPENTIEKYGPVFLYLNGNAFQKLQTPEGMPEEVINVYRGIATLLAVRGPSHEKTPENMEERPVVYTRFEEGLTGTCQTTYDILSDQTEEHHFNFTKTVNHMQCLDGETGRFIRNGHDSRGCQDVCPDHMPEKLNAHMEPDMGNWKTSEGCPVDFHPKQDLVEAFTTFNYNMTFEGQGVKLHQAQAMDKKILPLRKQQIKTTSLIQIRLAGERQGQTWETSKATKAYNTLSFRFPEEKTMKYDAEYLTLFGKIDRRELINQIIPMVKSLGDVIVSEDIQLKGRTGDKIIQLTMAISALNKHDIVELWTKLGRIGENPTEKQHVERQVILDVIGLSGTNYAAEFILDLIKNNELSTLETVPALETFQNGLIKPTTKIMDGLLEMCTRDYAPEQEGKRLVFSTACITLAELVRGRVEERKYNGLEHETEEHRFDIKKYIQVIKKELHEAKEFHEQVVYLQTLARFAHPEAIQALIPYVYGERSVIAQIEKMNRHDEHEDDSEYLHFIRQVAIYSLHHSVKEHGPAIQPIVQAIYFNREQPYEHRIAALSVLLATQPTEATFGRIVLELPNEDDKEVASFTYSALRSLANTTIPCMQQTARRVRNVLGGLPQMSFGAQYSKWFAHTKYDQLINLGLKGQFEVAHSNVSAIPRALYAGFTANKGPLVSTVGEFGFVLKGFENLDKLIFNNGGMQQIVEKVINRVRRNAQHFSGEASVEKMLDQLEQTMDFNTDENREEFRAVLTGSILGNNKVLPVDKEFMTKVAKKIGEKVFKILRSEESKSYRYVRILMPRTFVEVAPGVNGLPVVLSNRHPMIVSISVKDLKTRFGTETGKMFPLTVAASAVIRPTIYHTSVHSVLTINPFTQQHMAYGVRTVEQTHMTLPLDVAVQYTQQTKSFAFTLRPKFEKVFYHKTKAVTFKTPALLIRGVDQPVIERFTTLKAQEEPFRFERLYGEKLGMGLKVEGISFNEDYAVNFMRHRDAQKKNVLVSLLKQLNNQWFSNREWSLRLERNQEKPIDQIKMVVRVGDLLKERLHSDKQERELTREQIQKEESYPEEMRMVSYDHEYEKVIGRKPESQKAELEKALARMTQKTEKYWSQVDSELRQQLNKENTQMRSMEYIVALTGEKKTVVVDGHLMVAAPLSKQAKFAEFYMNVQDRPISIMVQAVRAYTPSQQPFNVEKIEKLHKQEVRGIVGLVADIETRSTGKQQYNGKIEMSKSEEQLRMNSIPQRFWYVRQCLDDIKENERETSSACAIANYEMSALNHIKFELELPEQKHETLKNATHKIREYLKVALYRNLRQEYPAKADQKKIQGEIIYAEKPHGMLNLTIITPDNEELHFERLYAPRSLRPNTKWSVKQTIKAALRQDRPEPECIYNGDNLRTFDNVTISLESMKQNQKYVIARDNDEQPKFIIVAEPKDKHTEVHILLRNTTLIKLTPSQNGKTYKVQMNSTEIEVTPIKAEIRQYARRFKHILTAHVEKHSEGKNTLVIKVRDQRLRVVYDGENLIVQIAKRMSKGQLTGICGDMNNQHIEELTGPRGCNYEREEDFVRSFSLVSEKTIEGEWECPEGVYPRDAPKQQVEEKRQRQQKMKQMHEQRMHQQTQEHKEQPIGYGQGMIQITGVKEIEGRICFSLHHISKCAQDYEQYEKENVMVPFACLNKQDPSAIQIQRQLQSNMPLPAGTLTHNLRRSVVQVQVQQPKICKKSH